jgi:putative phosphoesterase
MLIGIISDTHDNLPMIEKVIKRLNKENVALVLHAGDYVSPFVIPKFKALNAKLIGVLGNNDGDHEFLKKGSTNALNAKYVEDLRKSTLKASKLPYYTGTKPNF